METTGFIGIIWGYRGYIGLVENRMETTLGNMEILSGLYRGYMIVSCQNDRRNLACLP